MSSSAGAGGALNNSATVWDGLGDEPAQLGSGKVSQGSVLQRITLAGGLGTTSLTPGAFASWTGVEGTVQASITTSCALAPLAASVRSACDPTYCKATQNGICVPLPNPVNDTELIYGDTVVSVSMSPPIINGGTAAVGYAMELFGAWPGLQVDGGIGYVWSGSPQGETSLTAPASYLQVENLSGLQILGMLNAPTIFEVSCAMTDYVAHQTENSQYDMRVHVPIENPSYTFSNQNQIYQGQSPWQPNPTTETETIGLSVTESTENSISYQGTATAGVNFLECWMASLGFSIGSSSGTGHSVSMNWSQNVPPGFQGAWDEYTVQQQMMITGDSYGTNGYQGPANVQFLETPANPWVCIPKQVQLP